MKRTDSDLLSSLTRHKSFRVLIALGFLYILLVVFELPFVMRTGSLEASIGSGNGFFSGENIMPYKLRPERRIEELARTPMVSGLNLLAGIRHRNGTSVSAKRAVHLGGKLWREIERMAKKSTGRGFSAMSRRNFSKIGEVTICPKSISMAGEELKSKKGRIAVLPCGLTLGSHVTVIGRPRAARNATTLEPKEEEEKTGPHRTVSQFMVELVGLKMVEGEEPPKIVHFNPRIKGDWSGKPVIEVNSCYRVQWGSSQRCEGWKSRPNEDTVDGLVKCERWSRDDDDSTPESVASRWLSRIVRQSERASPPVKWPFPFAEGKMFVVTLMAGLEGYHMTVDGRHVTSFPYRPGFAVEDATGLYVGGDVDVTSVLAASLPVSHAGYDQKNLDLSDRWRAPAVQDGPIELFVGILSAGGHFAERMAARKSWVQHELVQSSNVVARFFVALHGRKEVNVEVRKEAEFFGDIVVVPHLDHYDLVVLKTIALCEFGVRTMSADYIMKADDDTFIRVDAVIEEIKKAKEEERSLYMGNMNYNNKALRSGKWAVTKEEWPDELYPTYANGAGYIISSDIANFLISDFEKNELTLFKMEDVSMGMWVERFNKSKRVEYVHSLGFCQFGCVKDYITAHYQSPRQMKCLWSNLVRFRTPSCCNLR